MDYKTSLLICCSLLLPMGLMAAEKPQKQNQKQKNTETKTQKPPAKNFYLKAETGASIPHKMHIQFNQPSIWAETLQGYDQGIGSRPFVGVGLGYEFCPLVSTDVVFAYRPQFKYRKFQTLTDFEEDSIYRNRVRKFDFDVSSLMWNVYLNGRGIDALSWNMGSCGILSPVIGGGIGVSKATIFNFRATNLPPFDPNFFNAPTFISENQYTVRYRFAYQAMAGLEFTRENWAIGMGYRYFNMNDFQGPQYFHDINGDSFDAVNNTWKMKFASNEVYFELKIFL